jgi:flagellar L-ring protein FlgH
MPSPRQHLTAFLAPGLQRTAWWPAMGLLVSGCAFNEPPPVELQSHTQPLSAAQIAQSQQHQQLQTTTAPQQATGSLFNASRYRPAFENYRARMVGDIVTIQINETVSASQASGSNLSRNSSIGGGITAFPLLSGGALANVTGRSNLAMGSDAGLDASGATTTNNRFVGTITTSVVEVLPNGHLVVTGEKQIGLNQNVDVLRFTGTVDPIHLRPNSTISSTQVANVRVESRGRGEQSSAQTLGWLSRFFLSFIPF